MENQALSEQKQYTSNWLYHRQQIMRFALVLLSFNIKMLVSLCWICLQEISRDFGPTTCRRPADHPPVLVTVCVFLYALEWHLRIHKVLFNVFSIDLWQVGYARLAHFIPRSMHDWIPTIASGHDVLGIEEFLSWLFCIFVVSCWQYRLLRCCSVIAMLSNVDLLL